jgi:predicted transcriptional regulator
MSIERLKALFPPQYNLYYPATSQHKDGEFDLFLRILPEPASRLYSGVKHFELRKYVPQHTGLVFLFETGRINAVTGCFFFREYLVDTLENLWTLVGTRATTREKFDAYFGSKDAGVALAVQGVTRFRKPIDAAELLNRFPGLPRPPEPYVYLYTPVGGPLSQFLRDHAPEFVKEFAP